MSTSSTPVSPSTVFPYDKRAHSWKTSPVLGACKVAVIWIDWYAYHLARYRALLDNRQLAGRAAGIELVGGAGVHGKLLFRENSRDDLPITTLFPDSGWADVSQHKAARAVWKALTSLNPDAVLVPGYYTLPGIAAALWARSHGKRSILMSETTREDHLRKPLREWGKARLIRALFDYATVGGVPHASYLESLGFPATRIRRSYDTVDNDFYSRGVSESRRTVRRSAHGLPENYFLYVGRLAKEKNLESLIDEFGAYTAAGGDWSLVIAGDGPMRAALQRRAVESGFYKRIHFCGMKTASGLIPYYAFAGCFVLPSTREPWGLVVNEAMAAGLPVIVSRRCGCAEDLVRNGLNGYVFEPGRRRDLALRLHETASMPAAERERMGRASQNIIACYSPTQWAAEVVKCLDL